VLLYSCQQRPWKLRCAPLTSWCQQIASKCYKPKPKTKLWPLLVLSQILQDWWVYSKTRQLLWYALLWLDEFPLQAAPAAGPWEEKVTSYYDVVRKPCPPCVVPIPTGCLGGHEVSDLPCSSCQPYNCHRPCGRLLACGNHYCSKECHTVTGAPNDKVWMDHSGRRWELSHPSHISSGLSRGRCQLRKRCYRVYLPISFRPWRITFSPHICMPAAI